MDENRKKYLKQIPAVNDLLSRDFSKELINKCSRKLLVEGIREVTDKLRKRILKIDSEGLNSIKITEDDILAEVEEFLIEKTSNNLVAAVNATGVVVHTNLGRSLLCDAAKERIEQIAANYSTLEINCKSGQRGLRYEIVEELLVDLTGAEAALVVNNNAAAVLLALSSLSKGKEAIVARGQLVEIGGSFRIPDVMEQGGAKLVEVGTTNRVHLKDYKRAINEETGILLKVHTSNYKVVGFSKEVALEELVNLGKEHNLPVVEDLGSGILVDLTSYGLDYEPTVQDSIEAGVDIVTFSGDKLLGGPQAGIIIGKKEYIDQMRAHPLNRALRVDKFTLASLEATLQEYRDLENAKRKIPTLKMLTVTQDELKSKADKLVSQLKEVIDSKFALTVEKDSSRVGGGAFPLEKLPTYVIKLTHQELSAERLAENLRLNNPPIFTRISEENVILDLRTLQEKEFSCLIEVLQKGREVWRKI